MTATFDMKLIQRGARLRRSPFFEATQKYGAQRYTVYNHMYLPTCYDDLEADGSRPRAPTYSWRGWRSRESRWT